MTLESATQLSSSARTALSSTNRRMTPQRAALLEIIQQADGHLDAEEIHRLARQRGERISLSTVYRTLDLLKALGLVDELHLWDEHHHYESRSARQHCHLLCRVCGQVTEVSGRVMDTIAGMVRGSHGFHLERAEVELVGVCRKCQIG